jgi:sugar-specific transcriptional regulator TrmB
MSVRTHFAQKIINQYRNNKSNMLHDDQKNIETLTELGLTYREAKIYFTLNKIGQATIKNLASAAKMDRPNVYGVIRKLQKLNLIEQLVTNPILIKAVPLDQGVLTLLENKKKEVTKLSVAAKELIQAFKVSDEDARLENGCKIMVIPKSKAAARKFKKLFYTTEKSNEAICYWPNEEASLGLIPLWKVMLKKNVQIRLVVYLPEDEKLPPKVLNLTKNPAFKIRYMSSKPKIPLSIYDEKDAVLATSMSREESLFLWVNSVDFVGGFFLDYFEMLWQNSSETKNERSKQ